VSAEREDEFMSSILGTIDALPTAPTTTKESRKCKSSPYEDEIFSHPPAFSGRLSYHQRSSSRDIDIPSPDGSWDGNGIRTGPPSSDDLVMSSAKKVKMDPSGLTPAVDKIAHLNVGSRSDDYDSSMDSSFDDIDMDAFMDVDNDDLDDKPSKSMNNIGIDSKPLRQVSSVPTKKEDNVPSWLSVYDSLTVTTEDSIRPLASSSIVTSDDKCAGARRLAAFLLAGLSRPQRKILLHREAEGEDVGCLGVMLHHCRRDAA
jgi:DNA polymerase alpha subunit A